jgi:putative transposase
VAASFFATLERELLGRHPWPTRHGLRTAVFDFIEVFYNPNAATRPLGSATPASYEQHR